MQRIFGELLGGGLLIDWVESPSEPEMRLPAACLDEQDVAAELGRIQRNRAREAAREAELIHRLAELRPETTTRRPARRVPDGQGGARQTRSFPG